MSLQSISAAEGPEAMSPDSDPSIRPSQTVAFPFERESVCYRCNFEDDPAECCERVTFLTATGQPPSWFGALRRPRCALRSRQPAKLVACRVVQVTSTQPAPHASVEPRALA